MSLPLLPQGMHVFERGWLSSNNVFLQNKAQTVLIDSGYCTHAHQTVALTEAALAHRPLDILVNTHLHSDHCGGNAALQARFAEVQTWIPDGQAQSVRTWDEDMLSFHATGQNCPAFRIDQTLVPGALMVLGGVEWEVHAAPGHDPHAILLYAPEHRTLISGDALWEDGFGVVFPELDGGSAFDLVASTLDVIERLNPACVVPGHGRVFTDVERSIAASRSRLNFFAQNPHKHLLYAAKVLVKFKLLELQTTTFEELLAWAENTPYIKRLQTRLYPSLCTKEAMEVLLSELVRNGAAVWEKAAIKNRN